MIRVLVDVTRGPEPGWTATISSPILDSPITRPITRLDGPVGGFPVVRPEDLPDGIAPAAAELATATDPAVIDDVRASIAARQVGESDIAAFGGYLHAVLLGPAWAIIVAQAAGQPVELALRWPVQDWELARLPWEIMRAIDPASGKCVPVAWTTVITRLVPCQLTETRIRISPRVLFVIGTDLNDVSIRPGAEFFSVWERLQQDGILFDFRVLQRASSQQIEDEIERFQPSIVHFICHGSESYEAGQLELVSTDASGRPVTERRNAQRCLDLLRNRAGRYPPIVVLSACYSGSQAGPVAARVDAPLAAALVNGGVPIVVGMGGQVSDVACRLFARRFYAALLTQEPVTDAIGEGRRAGLKHGSDPDRSVNWALPMLFLADQLVPQVDIEAGEVERVRQRAKRAQRLRERPNPIAFCDRIDVMAAQHALLDPHQPLQVLVLEETDYYTKDPPGKFGKTRALREIAARAVLAGHLPCLVTFNPGDRRPSSAEQLVLRMAQAIADAAELSGSAQRDWELRKLYLLISGAAGASADALRDEVRDEYQLWRASGEPELSARVMARALHLDLRTLAEVGQAAWATPDLRVIVLVDDVHQFDTAARAFIQLIGPDGIGDVEHPVPVVFAFSSQPGQKGYESSITLLKGFVDDNSQGGYLKPFSLERFYSPEQDPFSTLESLRKDPLALVYHQYLLHLTPGIVLRPGVSDEAAQWFLNEVHDRVAGIPSRLEITRPQHPVKDFIDSTLRQQKVPGALLVIDQVDDERALAEFGNAAP